MKTEARLAMARAALAEALDVIGRTNELVRPATFEVWPDSADPHEQGPYRVVVDRDGIVFGWDGTDDGWAISWKELRALCETSGELDYLRAAVAEARRDLGILRDEGHVIATIGAAREGA